MFDVIRHIFTIPLQNQRNSKGENDISLLQTHGDYNPISFENDISLLQTRGDYNPISFENDISLLQTRGDYNPISSENDISLLQTEVPRIFVYTAQPVYKPKMHIRKKKCICGYLAAYSRSLKSLCTRILT